MDIEHNIFNFGSRRVLPTLLENVTNETLDKTRQRLSEENFCL